MGWRGSNPGLSGEGVENHVAMSSTTNWPPNLNTYMVIDYCTLNIQSCMIPFCVRSNTLIKMMYHLLLYHNCTINYDHICTQIFSLKLTQFFMHTHRVILRIEPKSGFFQTKTVNCILCLDGYSMSVQEIVNKTENTI